jgi:methionine synthase II (cobalamin-independent)
MPGSRYIPDRVHLVGSIGLDTVEQVFETVGPELGRRLKRVPDGEPGGRRLWAAWQYPLLRANPYLRPDPSGAVRKNSRLPQMCLGEGVKPEELRFSELGYAREARASYDDFVAAREAGKIPEQARFQVCLPTPIAVTYSFCTPRDLIAITDAYEKAMLREAEMIYRHIPNPDLSLQWDLCQEMIILDGQPQDEFSTLEASKQQVLERIRTLCSTVPKNVSLGFHLCYGDFGAKHFIEPEDMAKLVEMANALSQLIAHKISYVHMPVPLSRTDDEYFKPLVDLKLDPDTEVYLGLIHLSDGAEGARRRIDTAHKYLKSFGVGTECGMARARTEEIVQSLLAIHTEVATEPVSASST